MEDVLSVYALAYDPSFPVICMDESCKQLVGEFIEPMPAVPGRTARIEHEYVRNGVSAIFLEVEPLTGRRHVEACDRRTKRDWAWWIKGMLEERYPEATQVVLVLDNLNTHSTASLYETFEPAQARKLAQRLQIHHTPKRGSWLNVAEIELSALTTQCLDRRLPDLPTLQNEIAAWEIDRNNRQIRINWQFTTQDARIKLRRLYPQL